MRNIIVLAIATWTAVAASIVLTYTFWRVEYLRPHAIWAISEIAAVVLSSIGLLAAATWHVVRGPDRWRAVGWLLIGLTPVVWIGAYGARLRINHEVVDSIEFDAPFRLVETWASSLVDGLARWKYSGRTHGRHVVLVDNGQTPNATQLVEEMDAHIDSMANQLGQAVPDVHLAWVRGALVGVNNVPIRLWALCGSDGVSAARPTLTRVDRHEVAHTFIFALAGPDHAPPRVLMEGWAVSQSGDREDNIVALARQHSAGNAYSLVELVGHFWYSRSSGPVYWEGGPLVDFLLERYGPRKFFDLYKDARQDTFEDDCREILGDSWETVDAEFWAWVEAETEAIVARRADEAIDASGQGRIQLAADVSRADWRELVTSYRDADRGYHKALPTDEAVLIESRRIDTGDNPWPTDERTDFQLRAVFAGDELWMVENVQFAAGHFVMVTGDQCADLVRYAPDGPLYGWTLGPSARLEVRRAALDSLGFIQGLTVQSPLAEFPPHVSPDESGRVPDMTALITNVNRPAAGGDQPWSVSYVWKTADGQVDCTCEIDIAPEFDWSVTRHVITNPRLVPRETQWQYRREGDFFTPWAMSERYGSLEATWEMHKRPLSDVEQQELRRRVEQAANSAPRSSYDRIRRLLLVSVIGCPLGGVILLAFTRRRLSPP